MKPSIELQCIDTNCNDCKFMVRDFDKRKSFDSLYTNSIGQVTNPSHRVSYGNCTKLNKDVSFIPNNCMPQNQHCFVHRKS